MNANRSHYTSARRALGALGDNERVVVADPALHKRIVAFAVELRRVVDSLRNEAAQPLREHFEVLLDDWQANCACQLDHLQHLESALATVADKRTAIQRVRRDLARWLRILCERSEAQMRSDTPASVWSAPLGRLSSATEALGTLSSVLDPAIFAPTAADSRLRKLRKTLAARKCRNREVHRGVPMRALTRQFVLLPALESFPDWQNRYNALRVGAWRALRRAKGSMHQLLARADQIVAEGGRVDWGAVREEIADGVTAIRDDLTRGYADLHARIDREVAAWLDDVTQAAMCSDTFLLPARVYEPGPSAASLEGAVAHMRAGAENWSRLANGTCATLAAALDADAFLSAVRYAHFRDSAEIASTLDTRLVEAAATFLVRVEKSRQQVLSALDAGSDTTEVERLVRAAREELHGFVEFHLRDVLRDPALGKTLQETVAELRRSTGRAIQRIGTGFRVIFEREARVVEGDPAPTAAIHEVHPRSVVDAVLAHAIEANVETTWRLLQGLLDETSEAAEEIVRAIDFHLEMALREFASEGAANHGAGRDYARAGFERVLTLAEALDSRIRTARDAVLSGVVDPVPEAFQEFERRIKEMLTSREDAARSQTVVVPAVADPFGGDTVRGDLLARFRTRLEGRAAIETIRRVTTRQQLVDAMRLASFDSVAEGPIPEGYVRLFRGSDDTTASIKFGLHDVVGRVRTALDAWEDRDPEAVAVTGHSGIGKGDLLDRVAEDVVSSYETHRIVLRERITRDEPLARVLAHGLRLGDGVGSLQALEEAIQSRGERSVVLLEGGEFIFLREARGLEAARAFLSLVTATSNRIFWVVTFERLAFEFLTSVLHLADAFTYVLELDLLEREEIEQLILTRHRSSGLGLVFSREINTDVDEPTRQREYFVALHEASGGHPALAAYYWLRSVRELNSRGQIVIGPLVPLPNDLLAPLDGVRRAALGALMLHGGLDRDSFAQAMRLAPDESASLLAQLRHMHLVECDELGVHDVNPVALLAIYRELRALNVF